MNQCEDIIDITPTAPLVAKRNTYKRKLGLVVVLDGVVVAARTVEELSSAVDAAVRQVHPEVGRQAALGADPVLRGDLWRIFELQKEGLRQRFEGIVSKL